MFFFDAFFITEPINLPPRYPYLQKAQLEMMFVIFLDRVS